MRVVRVVAVAVRDTSASRTLGIQGACLGLARNPEAQPKLMVFMILAIALAESIAIYGLVISLILLYANPLLG